MEISLLFALLVAPTLSQTPTAETVTRLIEQLAAPHLADRQAAARQLEAFGPAALPFLPEAAAIPESVHEELSQLRRRLERQLETESTKASRVSLSGRIPPQEAARQLSRETRNPLGDWPDTGPNAVVNVAWQQTSFWSAVTDLERQTGLMLRWDRDRGQFRWSPTGKEDAVRAVSSSGPFRMLVAGLQDRKSEDQELVRFECVLQAEPRLRPLLVEWPLKNWKLAVGNEVREPWNPDADYELPFPDDIREVALAVDFPRRAGESLTAWTLTGECHVHLAAGREPLVFAGSQLRRGAILQRGGVTASLRAVRFEPNGDRINAIVRLAVNYEQGGPLFESHRLGLFQRSAWLEDAGKRRIPFQELEVIAEADGGLAVEYRFNELPAPATQYRFLYEAPTLLLKVPVDVRLVSE